MMQLSCDRMWPTYFAARLWIYCVQRFLWSSSSFVMQYQHFISQWISKNKTIFFYISVNSESIKLLSWLFLFTVKLLRIDLCCIIISHVMSLSLAALQISLQSSPCWCLMKLLIPVCWKLLDLGFLSEWIWGSVRYVSPFPLAVVHPEEKNALKCSNTLKTVTRFFLEISDLTLQIHHHFLTAGELVGEVTEGDAVLGRIGLRFTSWVVCEFHERPGHVRLGRQTGQDPVGLQNLKRSSAEKPSMLKPSI